MRCNPERRKRMRILLVNDDGISAPGLAALARTAVRFGEVWVVAPDHQCSGMSQKLTLFEEMRVSCSDFPVLVKAAFSVGGTPADCVKIALDSLLPERPDYVFSGVNDGWNAGFDIAYSGTIGACYEAVMNGIPAIAFSTMGRGGYACAERHMPALTEELLALGQGRGEIWNLNFPADEPKGVLYDRRIAPMQLYNGLYSKRKADGGAELYSQRGVPCARADVPDGTDIAAVLDGYISVGRIQSGVMC